MEGKDVVSFWLSGKKDWSIFINRAVRGEKINKKTEATGAKSLSEKTGAAVAKNFISISATREIMMIIAPIASIQRLSKV